LKLVATGEENMQVKFFYPNTETVNDFRLIEINYGHDTLHTVEIPHADSDNELQSSLNPHFTTIRLQHPKLTQIFAVFESVILAVEISCLYNSHTPQIQVLYYSQPRALNAAKANQSNA